GNAVDAAVATGFALAVVHPQAGNLGGGGFMLIRMADGSTHFIDYRETAPAAATANMYLDAKGNVIPDASVLGYKSIAVPGSVAGLAYAQKKYGKLPLATVMQPAIKLARDGFVLSHFDGDDFRDSDLAKFPESRRVFQSDSARSNGYYEESDLFKQPELARTLERIAQDPDDFYHGTLARALAAAVQQGGGLVTEKDLAAYAVKERAVVTGSYRGYDIITSPPPSSGGVMMLEALNILEPVPLHSMGDRSADSIHWTVEAFRRAYMDRAEFLGDPDFVKVPVAQLLDKKYADKWRESIDPVHPTPSALLKRPSFEDLDRTAHAAAPEHHESPQTTHYSVVDEQGNAVAVTTTLNDIFGSHVTANGLGFLLNDEMDDFTSKPGVPNLYGLIQGTANAIAGGKRPLSSMTPTIVVKDNKPFLVLGSPGGSRIITSVANFLMGVIDYGLNIQEAVDAPRFHHQWMPDAIYMERVGFSPDTEHLLEQRGNKLQFLDSWSDGECIMIDPKTGERMGASDPRHGGRPAGY
ncbi:MAG TPA: gamma-glutamyltransferase, partial [Terriglobales bacterium]|nr:gamma-glutamyltransferase [Terriglobales bacterium]